MQQNVIRLGAAWQSLPDGRERLESLLEIYRTALEELRARREPRSAGLIVSLESLYAAAAKELRYLDTSTGAAVAAARRQAGGAGRDDRRGG